MTFKLYVILAQASHQLHVCRTDQGLPCPFRGVLENKSKSFFTKIGLMLSHFYSQISIIKLNSTILFAFKSQINHFFLISNIESQDQSKFVKYSILDI